MKKNLVFIAIVAVAIMIIIALYLSVQNSTISDGKGFMPIEINFENGIQNITLSPGSSAFINTTFTSNLDKEITITIKPTLAALDNPLWFDVTIQPNPLTLNAYGTNSTTLTIHLTEKNASEYTIG